MDQGEEGVPVTWENLIRTLRECEIMDLADRLEDAKISPKKGLPVTWEILIRTLKECEIMDLADRLEDVKISLMRSDTRTGI